MGSGWAPAADALGAPEHEFPVTELPGFPPPAVDGPRRHDPLVPDRRQARAGLPGPHPLLRGPRRRRRRARRPYRRRRRLQDHRAHQRLRRPARGHAPRPAGPHQRPHQPHRHLPDRRRELRRPDRPVLAAAARAVQGDRPDAWRRASTPSSPARTTRPRPRSAWSATIGARPGRHVHRPGGHRRARGGRRGARASPWSPTSPPGMTGEPLNHEEVLQAGRDSATRMGALLAQVLGRSEPATPRSAPSDGRDPAAPDAGRPRLSAAGSTAAGPSQADQRRIRGGGEPPARTGSGRPRGRRTLSATAPARPHERLTTVHDDLIARAQAWLAEDPDPETRDELAKLIERRRTTSTRARRPLRRHPPVRHRRAARRARRGPDADEPLRGHPRRRRPRRVPQGAGPTAAGLVVIGYDARHKSRRLRPRHRGRDDRRGPARRACCPARCPPRCSPSP